MEHLTTIIVAIITSTAASSGLWAFVLKKTSKRGLSELMLIGVAHDRILSLGLEV